MKKVSTSIEKLGFNKWFQDEVDPENLEKFEIARVIAVHKDSYTINYGKEDIIAELVGNLLFSAGLQLIIQQLGIGYLQIFMMETVLVSFTKYYRENHYLKERHRERK